MNIFGVGTDIVNIKRIENLLKRNRNKLKEKIFSKSEINYCENKKFSGPFFAKRYAAKEALAKALGMGFKKGISLKNIEVTNNKFGKPSIKLKGTTLLFLKKKN